MIVSILDFELLMKCILAIESRQNTNSVNLQLFRKKITSAQKVNPQDFPPNVVSMNSFIKLNQVNTGIIFTVKLVYPEFENIKERKISIFSTMGEAIFSRRIGDEVTYKTRQKEKRIKIMDVIFQPEANGNYYIKSN
jgi:regulator of nucleoside diphosphate kinase